MLRYPIAALLSALWIGWFACPSSADSLDDYLRIRSDIWFELDRSLFADDKIGIAARRDLLRRLFSSVPPEFALEFHEELGIEDNGGEFSQEFHGRLATATREEMLNILFTLSASVQPELSGQQPEVAAEASAPFLGLGPLPTALEGTFFRYLDELKTVISVLDPVRQARMECALSMLQDLSVDDRVIEWRRICPSEAGVGLPFVTSCESISDKVGQGELFEFVRSQSDVPSAGEQLRFITHLRSLIVSIGEFGLLPEESMADINDQIILTSIYLEKMTTAPLGGGSATPDYYAHIKQWLREAMSGNGSVLSCFRE